MRRLLYLLILIILAGAITMVAFSPDALSMADSVIMLGVLCTGMIMGILPLISIRAGLLRGEESIKEMTSIQSDSIWSAIEHGEKFFRQKSLDEWFENYKEKVRMQRNAGQVISDVEDFINGDVIAIKCWNNVLMQIPGTLTGLGILGTFIGLIIGVSGIGFSSVDAALLSVETLLHGINIAFYTSIAGVILSICFNILHKITWNITTRETEIFAMEFHKYVIPPLEEQTRYVQSKTYAQILEKLDRIPKNPGFSLGNMTPGQISAAGNGANEKILMPQIIDGMKRGEFIFVLQPKYDINTRRVVAAEAYVRWNHSRLGMVSPGVFLPIVEENGYITKLDEYVWDSVCKKIRTWIDSGIHVVPVSINISKTDILAGNVLDDIDRLMDKYKLPPRMLDIEIARNAFVEAGEVTSEIAEALRKKGFKVILDGFDGDYVPINTTGHLHVDELKLDLRRYTSGDQEGFIKEVFEHSKRTQQELVVEGIESMEQVTLLRKLGCNTGQGYFFSKPITQESFEELISS